MECLFFPQSVMASVFLLLFVCQGNIAAKAQTLWVGNLTQDVYGPPADFAWSYFADFCNLAKIAPAALSFCFEGVPGQVGQHRYLLSNVGSPSNVNETYVRFEEHILTAIDPTHRTLSYIAGKNNFGVTSFTATVKILPKSYGCQIKWDYAISPFGVFQYGQHTGLSKSMLKRVAENLENLLINIE